MSKVYEDDAVHLAAAIEIGATVLSSADSVVCRRRAPRLHVATLNH